MEASGEGRWRWLTTPRGYRSNPETPILQRTLKMFSSEKFLGTFSSSSTLCSLRLKTPRTQIHLNGLSLTRRLPTQAYSSSMAWPPSKLWVSAARTSPRLHTVSSIPESHPGFLAILLGFWEAARIQKMPPNRAGTSTPLSERDYSTVS